MTATLAERTDWRAGFGNAVPLSERDVRHYVSGFASSGASLPPRIPTLLGIAGTGSLFINAILPLSTQATTAAPATEWPSPMDAGHRDRGDFTQTAAQELAHELRRVSGLTNEEIAPLTGVSRRSFQAWLAGGAISARKEMRLRRLAEAINSIGDVDPLAMRSRLLGKGKGSARPYDLLAEGRFDAAVALATGRAMGGSKSRVSGVETVAQQFDRDQGSLPTSGGRLNRNLSKPLRR